MSAKCKHLSISAEAYRIDPETNAPTPIPAFLCVWPCRLPVMPGWMNKRVGGGSMVDPHIDCVNCPCFEKGQPI